MAAELASKKRRRTRDLFLAKRDRFHSVLVSCSSETTVSKNIAKNHLHLSFSRLSLISRRRDRLLLGCCPAPHHLLIDPRHRVIRSKKIAADEVNNTGKDVPVSDSRFLFFFSPMSGDHVGEPAGAPASPPSPVPLLSRSEFASILNPYYDYDDDNEEDDQRGDDNLGGTTATNTGGNDTAMLAHEAPAVAPRIEWPPPSAGDTASIAAPATAAVVNRSAIGAYRYRTPSPSSRASPSSSSSMFLQPPPAPRKKKARRREESSPSPSSSSSSSQEEEIRSAPFRRSSSRASEIPPKRLSSMLSFR